MDNCCAWLCCCYSQPPETRLSKARMTGDIPDAQMKALADLKWQFPHEEYIRVMGVDVVRTIVNDDDVDKEYKIDFEVRIQHKELTSYQIEATAKIGQVAEIGISKQHQVEETVEKKWAESHSAVVGPHSTLHYCIPFTAFIVMYSKKSGEELQTKMDSLVKELQKCSDNRKDSSLPAVELATPKYGRPRGNLSSESRTFCNYELHEVQLKDLEACAIRFVRQEESHDNFALVKIVIRNETQCKWIGNRAEANGEANPAGGDVGASSSPHTNVPSPGQTFEHPTSSESTSGFFDGRFRRLRRGFEHVKAIVFAG